jgi:serine/threonine-protein kinase
MHSPNELLDKIRSIFPRWLRISLFFSILILALEGAALVIIRSNPEYQTGMASMTVDTIMPIPTQALTMMPTQTLTLIPTPTMGIGSTIVSEKDGMVMLYVPAGEFDMGSDEGPEDESPVHTVYLDAYWIDQTEVTNDQYRMCVEAGGCNPPKNTSFFNITEYAEHPVVYVNWNDANDYCQWAGRKLPTEAQWEKAARGTDGRTFPWGEEINCSRANYLGCTEFAGTNPVGYYGEPGESPYGALDMAGNVWEWVADWYDSDYYRITPRENPIGPISGDTRVVRGGSWDMVEYAARSTFRLFSLEIISTVALKSIGFRCANSVVFP